MAIEGPEINELGIPTGPAEHRSRIPNIFTRHPKTNDISGNDNDGGVKGKLKPNGAQCDCACSPGRITFI